MDTTNEDGDLRPLGGLVPLSPNGLRITAFRMSGYTLKPTDFETIGSLRPGRKRSNGIGTLLAEIGYEMPKSLRREPAEMAALTAGIAALASLRSRWRSAELVTEDLLTATRDRAFDCLRLLGFAMRINENHDVNLGHRIESFRLHGYVVDTEDEYHGMVVDDWVWCFAEFPLWAVDYAMKRCIRAETRKNGPAAVLKYIPKTRLETGRTEFTNLVNNAVFWHGSLAQITEPRA